MSWAYQIYIVAAPRLKGEHYPCQFFPIYAIALAELAYGVVLAEDTFKITVGKKDGA